MNQSRREILFSALALGIANPLPVLCAPKLTEYPYTLGVASGEPTADGIVL